MKPAKLELQFVAALQHERPRRAPHIVAMEAEEIMRLGKQHSRASVNLCNLPNYQESYDKRTNVIRRKLAAVLKPYGATALTGGDPRGCTVKLVLRSGLKNDFGGEGYCVPGA